MALTIVSDADLLDTVKSALGITGNYLDSTLTIYINDVKDYMQAGGVPVAVTNSRLAVGAICRGVADLWNYGAGNTEFSTYFLQRVTQLALTVSEEGESDE